MVGRICKVRAVYRIGKMYRGFPMSLQLSTEQCKHVKILSVWAKDYNKHSPEFLEGQK
jgi:hypothetical protein